jgi:hypothetical protein
VPHKYEEDGQTSQPIEVRKSERKGIVKRGGGTAASFGRRVHTDEMLKI